MRKLGIAFLVASVCFGLTGLAMAADFDEHQVTVQVSAINEIAIAGGDIVLTINSATAGQDPDDATNNTCDLDWTTNQSSKKITVETDLASQSFTLKVVAQNVTGGTAAPEVTVTDSPLEFVSGISQTTGGCDLQYTASATAAQGTGSDVHTIRYTITDA